MEYNIPTGELWICLGVNSPSVFSGKLLQWEANPSTQRLSLTGIMAQNLSLFLPKCTLCSGSIIAEEKASGSNECLKCVHSTLSSQEASHMCAFLFFYFLCIFNCDFLKHQILKWPGIRIMILELSSGGKHVFLLGCDSPECGKFLPINSEEHSCFLTFWRNKKKKSTQIN